ncbi:MAG: PAS domain-containing protein [Bacteroidetes bacterium]|nr:PAS domain-containing protein [Bacteroidota bacterium]
MTSPTRILIIARSDGDAEWLVLLLSGLREQGFEVGSVATPEQFLGSDSLQKSDVIVIDVSVDTEWSDILLHDLTIQQSSTPVILTVEKQNASDMSSVVRRGAQDFIIKDSDTPEVVLRILVHATDRSHILRATQEAEERVRAIIENISDGILIVDEADTILYANPACEDLLNKPLIELLGAPLDIEIPESSPAVVEIEYSPEYSIIASLRWVPIRWEGRNVRLYTIRDISAEHEVREQLKRTKEEAERLAALKASFLANMSHELRMPLASIIGFAQLIEEGVENPDFKEFSGMIVESGNRLLETINSVLELTRLDAESFAIRQKNLSLAVEIRDVVNGLKPLLDEKMIPVKIVSDDDGWIRADPVVIQRIFTNIIGNAIKFTDEGEITVTISSGSQTITCAVSDTGIGIDPDFLPNVFDEFAQESMGRGRTHEGSGLGMAITRRLIQSMGGSIEVTSEKGKGSTFFVRFPWSAGTPESD